MGASGSKGRANDAKLKPDNISTVSMALDGQSKSRGNRQQQPSNGTPSAPGATTTGQVYSIPKGLPANPSSARFNGGSSNRAMDLNGNHFYNPSSLGKASATSSINAGDDPNNNNQSNGSKSPAPVKVDIEKSSRRSLTSLPRGSVRGQSRLSQYSLNEPIEEIEMVKGKTGRKSGSIAVVFLLELASIAGLAVLAYFLHFTDHFGVVKRDYKCGTFIETRESPYKDSIIFSCLKETNFILLFLLAPIGVILVLEILRQLIIYGLSHNSSNDTVVLKKIGISFPLCIRRIIRITAGFLFGILMTSILVDVIKLQTGQFRPYFGTVCANLTEYCKYNPGKSLNESELNVGLNLHCDVDDIREARLSFPSLVSAMAAYSAFFLLMYLAFALPYRALRFARLWAMLAICVVFVFTINAGLATNRHHLVDSIFGVLIGLFFAIYAVFIHVNAFANRLSVSNFFGAKRAQDPINTVEGQLTNSDPFDEISHSNLFAENDKEQWFWKNFHIPRVHTLRQSARNMWRKSENYFSSRPTLDSSHNSPRTNVKRSNAYINPAFNGRDDNILANHLHQETRFGGNNGTAANGTNQRSTLRTFQANS